jgi:hypothetical protein
MLGVAMASGTFVLTDTINGAFNAIFTQSYKNADDIITGKTAFENLNGNGVQAPSFPETLCDARTQGGSLVVTIEPTEDAAARRRVRPGGTIAHCVRAF